MPKISGYERYGSEMQHVAVPATSDGKVYWEERRGSERRREGENLSVPAIPCLAVSVMIHCDGQGLLRAGYWETGKGGDLRACSYGHLTGD